MITNKLTIQEKLGFAKQDKLIIIHADDFGMCHSQNVGTIQALQLGVVNSVSVMVCCPWFLNAASYIQQHPDVDVGLHLTLTSEWSTYKWGPVAPVHDVLSLVDAQGFFYSSVELLLKNARPDEVERELVAQIEKLKSFGIEPTHIDSHMFACLARPDLIRIYNRVSESYKLPALLSKVIVHPSLHQEVNDCLDSKFSPANVAIVLPPEMYAAFGAKSCYERILTGLPEGLNVLLIHPAVNSSEMQAIAAGEINYGALWRQHDLDYFSSDECKALLISQNIKRVSWREIKNVIAKAQPQHHGTIGQPSAL